MQKKHIKLIPGKILAAGKKTLLKAAISQLGEAPQLKIIQVGDDASSSLYVGLKVAAAIEVGINAQALVFPTGTNPKQVISKIQEFNSQPEVKGIMVQSPIPGLGLIESLKIFNAISPKKDVDGLSFASLGKLWQYKSLSELFLDIDKPFVSATPLGVLDCLLWLARPAEAQLAIGLEQAEALITLLQGKKALIINRSNIVGKPLAALLTLANATVTLAHSYTPDVHGSLSNYDFVLPATGIDNYLTMAEFQTGQVVIDIGINNNNQTQQVRGDVIFSPEEIANTTEIDATEAKVYLAPVPGGVGPLTVVNLLANTYSAALS